MKYEEIFGNMKEKWVESNHPIKVGDKITITNSNCEFGFDVKTASFDNDVVDYNIVDLEIIEVDLTNYEPSKSNNGGCYAFAECIVKKVYE